VGLGCVGACWGSDLLQSCTMGRRFIGREGNWAVYFSSGEEVRGVRVEIWVRLNWMAFWESRRKKREGMGRSGFGV
jgi:hypothetical protein